MSCDNQNENLQKGYQQFVNEIMPNASVFDDALNKKVIDSGLSDQVTTKGFSIMLRSIKKSIEIFREENIPLFTELQNLESQYGALSGALMVEIDGEEKDAPASQRLFRVNRSRDKRSCLPESCSPKNWYQR